MRKPVNVVLGKQGFQRTRTKAVSPAPMWLKPASKETVGQETNPTSLDSIYSAYVTAIKASLSQGKFSKDDYPTIQAAYLARFEPFTDKGEWPAEHLHRSGACDPDSAEPLVIYTDASLLAGANIHNPETKYNASTSWAWIDLESRSWSAGALPHDTTASTSYLEAYAILDAVVNTPLNRPLRILTDYQGATDTIKKIQTSTDFIPESRRECILAAAVMLSRGRDVTFEWVKGHNGNQGNHVVDKVAKYVRAISEGREPLDKATVHRIMEKAIRKSSPQEVARRAEGYRRYLERMNEQKSNA